jgi:hypothetical protein
MSNEQRKASDIIVELEAKIDTLSRHIQNIDNNIKLILNRLSQNNTIKTPSLPPDSNEISGVKKSNLPEIYPNVVAGYYGSEEIKSDNIQPIKKVEEEKDFDFPQVETENSTTTPGRKVAVQQRITYSDGKNICLANVEIKNASGVSIKKLRTNAMGKWIAVLEPGNYIVSVLKSANKTNPDVELSNSVVIQESDRPIELPILRA